MERKELDFVLEEGEGQFVEFKERFDKSIAKEIVAFANAGGGRVFLGISDKNDIKGVEVTNKLKSEVQDVARKCDPFIGIKLERVGDVLVVGISEGENKPYKCSEGFYMRQGANSQKMSRDEILSVAISEGKLRFDEKINRKFDFEGDFNEKGFVEFLKKMNVSRVMTKDRILENLLLGKFLKGKFKLNNAGVLFFAKEPDKFIVNNFVRCVLYKGKERVDVIDRKDFTGDLLSNYLDGISFLKQHLKLSYIIKGAGARREVLELPIESLREALLNAVVHRDYHDEKFGVFVEIFDDRVEVTNKGKLFFDRVKLGSFSVPRNPIIFDIFYRLNLIEKIGSGINRIRKGMRERGLKVKFETDDYFRVIFGRKKVEPLSEPLSEPLKKIVGYVGGNDKVNRLMIIERLGFSRASVARYLGELKKKGLLKRVGSKKNGYYVLGKEGEND